MHQMSISLTVIGQSLWNRLPPPSCNTILSSNLSTSLALINLFCLGANHTVGLYAVRSVNFPT